MVRLVSPVQLVKAEIPIEVTLSGIVISSRAVQSKNAYLPNPVISPSNTTDLILPLKEY